MTNKPNDFFATFLFQPQTTFGDLAAEGLTADNTGLESRDHYKSISKVQETFVDKDGNFDETTFNNFYDNMLILYNDYAKQDYEKILLDNVEYNPDVWWAPKDSNKMDTRTEIQFGKNPMKVSAGVNYLTQTSKPTMSIRELAQANTARDSETGESLGWTPNEKGGLFKSFSRPTLVLATWDEDGFHEEDGVMVQHLKGGYKFDEDGSPYYETLGDREIYDKDVLHYTDTFTVDGSKMNKYDFFDSDGLDKTIGGTLMKTAATVLPMLIPYVGPVIGGITAAVNLAQLVPVLGKSLNGIISNNDNEFGKSLTKLEGYLERFTPSTSDYSRNKMITMENLGNLVSQISTQLFQQKAVGMIPGLLGDYTNKKNVELGQKMVLAYMAGTSAKETYASFRSAGASEEVSGLAMLANVFALYGLMNSEYLGYKDSLFKGSWLDESVSKAPAWNVAKEWGEKYAKENVETAVENAAKNKNVFNWFQNRFKDNYGKVLNNSTFVARSVNEGIEEVLEEAVVDLTKAITSAGNALGLKVTEDNKTLNFGYTLEDTLARYAMSFGGGVLGGAIFQMHGKWDDFLHNKFLEKTEVEDLSKLTYMIAEGRAEEIRDYYRKWHKEGRLGSTNLGSKFETIEGVDGKTVVNEAAVDGSTTHNDVVFEALMKQVDLIESILSEEGLKINEKTLGEVLKLGGDERGMALADTFVKTGLFGSFLNEFNRLGTTIVKKRAELDAALAEAAPSGDTAANSEESKKKIKNNERIKVLEEELKELRKERDAILKGERNDKYMGQIFLMMNDNVNKFFLQLTKDNFARGKYNKDYNSLSQAEKDFIDQEFEDYSKTEGRNDLYRAWDVYSGLSEIWALKIQEAAESLVGYSETKGYKGQYGAEYFKTIANAQKLLKTVEQLSTKESLTPEEGNQLTQAQESLDKLNTYLLQLENAPELATQQILDDETIQSFRLLGLDAPVENILGETAKILENKYTEARNAKTVLPDDNDLNGFYSTYLKTRYNATPEVKFREMLEAIASPDSPLDFDWVTDLIESGGEAFASEDGNIFDIQFNDRSQKDFIEQVDTFVKNLGSDNIKAIKAYNEAEHILRTYSTAPDEAIEFVMDYFFGKINNESIADFVKRIDGIRKDIKYHPFEDLFSEFFVTINGHDSKILDLLKSEEKQLALQERLLNYSIESDALKNELREVGYLLNAFKGIIHGSFDGLNERVNSYRINAKHPEFANIDENVARILLQDAERLQNRIDTLLRLNEAAQSRKLKIQQRIASNMRPKFIKSIFCDPFIENIKTVFGNDFGEEYSKIWESVEKPDGYTTLTDLSVKESDYGDWDRVFIEAETGIFDLFKSFFGNDIYKKNFAEKVTKLFGEGLYKMVSTRLSDNPEEIVENYDALVYFASLITLNSQDFYTKYKEVIGDSSFPFAPIFSQEMAVKENYAMALRPDLFNNIAELLRDGDNPDNYIANKKSLQNVIMTLGGAGTGKTTSIANIVVKMLDGKDLDIIAITPTTDQLTKLKTSIGKPEIKGYTKDEVFKLITTNPNGIESSNIEYDENAATLQPKDINASDTAIYDSGKKIKVFVIDEIGCFSKVELELLSKYAVKHNILIMGLGDFKQTSAVIRLKDKSGNENSYPNGIDDFNYIKTPSLTASLRVDNLAKLNNYNILNDLAETIVREYQKNPTWDASKLDAELSKYLTNKINLKYYSEGKKIIGEKFVDDSTQLIDEINRVKGLGSILIIADDPAKYVSITDVEVRGSENVNGAEADYVFVDKNWKVHDSSKFDLLRDLYTVSQRSRKATVMINNGIMTDLIISNDFDANTNQNYSQDPKAIEDFKKWRLEHLEPIHESENFEENTSYFALAKTTPKPKEIKPTEPKSEEPPKKETIVPPSKPVETPSATKATTPPPPVEESSIEPEIKKEVQPENPKVEDRQKYRFKSAEEIIDSEQKSGKSSMNLGEFYSTIYDNSFVAKEADKADSSYTWFNGKINNEEYVKFVNLLSGLIRRNLNPSNDKDFALITRQFSNNRTVRAIKEFKKLIDTHGYEIRLEAISSELSEVCFITKDIKTYIGTVHSGKSGVYTGTFTQVSNADYDRSEQTKRVRISDLSNAFPGIRVGKNWGIVSHNSDANIPESIQAWTFYNNGKSMIICTDDPLFTEKELSDSFRTTKYEDGTDWAIANRDFLTLAGLQRRATPSDVIRYAIAMHYKRTGKDLDSAVSILLDRDVSTLSDVDKNNAIEDYITNYTKSARDIIRPLPNAGREAFSNFYKRLSHTDYNILSGDFRLGNFIAKCINNPKLQDIVLKNLSAMMMRDSKIGKSKSAADKKNILRVTINDNDYDIEWKDNNWYSIHLPNGNLENVNLGSILYPFNAIVDKIGEIEGIDNPLVSNITIWEKTKNGLYPENMNETLYYLFYGGGIKVNMSVLDNALDGEFLYAQDAGGEFYKNSVWRKHISSKDNSDDFDGYTTTASNWRYSIFSIDDSQIITGSEQKVDRSLAEIDRFNGLKEEIDELIKGTSLKPYDYEFDPTKESSEEAINEYIKFVNDDEQYKKDSWVFNWVARTDSGFIINSAEKVKTWLYNLLGDVDGPITIYDDFKTHPTWKYVNFSVTLDSEIKNFIVQNINGKWVLSEFNSAPEYNQMMSVLKSAVLSEEDNRAIKEYVLSIQTDNTTFEMAEAYNNVISKYPEINQVIMNYLTKRLELNEC